MSTVLRAVAAARAALRQGLAAAQLTSCDALGRHTHLIGRPYVHNQGSIEIGDGLVLVSRPIQSHIVVERGGRLVIGDRVHISHGAAISVTRLVTIEDGARLGPLTAVLDNDLHIAGDMETRPESRPVRIGKGAVIGAEVTILPGTEIGEGARVMAGSVVRGRIAPGVTASGVPARPVGEPPDPRPQVQKAVAAALQRALQLPSAPPLSARRRELAGWDEAATLRVLVELEDRFGDRIVASGVARAESVAELAAVVQSSLDRGKE